MCISYENTGYESLEQDRPQFEGEEILSPVNGQSVLYFAKADKDYRVRIANVIQSLLHFVFCILYFVFCILCFGFETI